MKKSISIFLTALAVVVQAQMVDSKMDKGKILPVERSLTNLPLVSDVRSTIEYALGWALQDNGEWISAENKLPFKNAGYNQSSKAYYKLGQQNFTSLEMRDIMIDNELYVIFIIRYKTGWYEFPILMEQWHSQYAMTYYVFNSDKLKEVLPEKLEFNQPYIVNMDVLCDATLVEYNEKTLNSTIAYNIKKTFEDKTFAAHNLLIAVWPVQAGGQMLTRFRLIDVMNKKRLYLPYLEPSAREKLFRSTYWEVDYTVFKAFIQYSGSPVPTFTGIPRTAEEYYRRGVSNYTSGNYGQAIIDLSEAAKYPVYSNFFLTYAYRANARQKSGDIQGAMQDYDKAVSLKPADQSYYSAWLTTIYNRGVARLAIKDKAGACQDWNTALQLGFRDLANDKAIKENCKNYPFVTSSVPFTTMTSSIPGQEADVTKYNDYYKVYWEGIWKYEKGDFQEALRYFNRALELRSSQGNYATLYYYLGSCKLKLSDYIGAIYNFDFALSMSINGQLDTPTIRTVYYNRGMANYFIGNTSIAFSDFQKAVNLGFTDPESLNFIRQVCK